MTYTVGPKGQVVIAKEIRDKLGVAPGWVALQRLAGDHAEVYFVPPPHHRSLKGSLTRFTKVKVPPGRGWVEARKTAWAAESRGGGYRRSHPK
jgi:hypothetical protein